MKKKNKLSVNRYSCYKCFDRFTSWQKRDAHLAEAHKPPVKTSRVFEFETERTLLGALGQVSLGSNVKIEWYGTVIKLTETEGSKNVAVTLGIKKHIWVKDF